MSRPAAAFLRGPDVDEQLRRCRAEAGLDGWSVVTDVVWAPSEPAGPALERLHEEVARRGVRLVIIDDYHCLEGLHDSPMATLAWMEKIRKSGVHVLIAAQRFTTLRPSRWGALCDRVCRQTGWTMPSSDAPTQIVGLVAAKAPLERKQQRHHLRRLEERYRFPMARLVERERDVDISRDLPAVLDGLEEKTALALPSLDLFGLQRTPFYYHLWQLLQERGIHLASAAEGVATWEDPEAALYNYVYEITLPRAKQTAVLAVNDKVLETLRLFEVHRQVAATARDLGLSRGTITYRLDNAVETFETMRGEGHSNDQIERRHSLEPGTLRFLQTWAEMRRSRSSTLDTTRKTKA